MTGINVLIKPASGACNLRCGYCFYADETAHREVGNYGFMSRETLERVVCRAFETGAKAVNFAFQGGEPTLCGLDFFKEAVALQKRYAPRGVQVSNALQTNGLLIDGEWARFLKENGFLTGLSLDGYMDLHDANRVDPAGRGSFARVMAAADALKAAGAEFNVLTVVTGATAQRIRKIYAFFRKNDLLWQQYIPCLEPLGDERGRAGYALTPTLYARFLKELFDLWYEDVAAGRFIYIRYFENLVGMLLGRHPESCGLSGRCALQFVVEADGGVYPCDFYVLDPYRMGNVRDAGFKELAASPVAQAFLSAPAVHEDCARCSWYALCRGGCRRDRDDGTGRLDVTYFCPAYREFFAYALPRLERVARGVAARGVR